jgi:hypothetical protein
LFSGYVSVIIVSANIRKGGKKGCEKTILGVKKQVHRCENLHVFSQFGQFTAGVSFFFLIFAA